MKGYECGADSYILKPFSARLLHNNDSFSKLFNDPDFYNKVQEAMAAELYKALRKD